MPFLMPGQTITLEIAPNDKIAVGAYFNTNVLVQKSVGLFTKNASLQTLATVTETYTSDIFLSGALLVLFNATGICEYQIGTDPVLTQDVWNITTNDFWIHAPVANAPAREALTDIDEGVVVVQLDDMSLWGWKDPTWYLMGADPTDVWLHAPVANAAARIALTVATGTIVIQLDTFQLWEWAGASPGWKPINVKNNINASNPTVNNDQTQGYNVGSLWLNSTHNTMFVAKDISTGAAVWIQLNLLNQITGANPTADDDNTVGYTVNSFWINSTSSVAYICEKSLTANAIWTPIVRINKSTNANPTANDDSTLGYSIGSVWINTDTHIVYVAESVGAATAVWVATELKNNSSASPPTVHDDDTEGYSVYSLWIDKALNKVYIAKSVSTGAASWIDLWSPWLHAPVADAAEREGLSVDPGTIVMQLDAHQLWAFRSATYGWDAINPKVNISNVAPTPDDDLFLGYSAFSLWINSANSITYICQDNFGAAATWIPLSKLDKATAADPTNNDDETDGYTIGSLWINTSSNQVFIAKSVFTGSAVWILFLQKNNTSTSNPTANDDIDDGYSIGSMWINTANGTAFTAQSVSAAAAVWLQLNTLTHSSTSNPTANDDSGDGYTIGSLWINTANNIIFIAKDVTVTFAVWIQLNNLNNSTTSSPTVNDDEGDGYSIYSIWIDISNSTVYIAQSVASGAAVWIKLNNNNPIIPQDYSLTTITSSVVTGTNLIGDSRIPFACTISSIRMNLNAASTLGDVTIDVLKNGTTIFTTILSIDQGSKTSVGSASPYVLATTSFADNDIVTFDVVGAGVGASGLKAQLLLVKT